ncbi:Skp family chaperone for outer membrane proteins [Planomicrobium stackebrandtii]|uniref:Skp family chaperone for outer membrane proteins n=1 Tax=Planomicrobium stackebrandtii TaxID=253160 RepID=A0ABU0GVU1_9BACL|nr:hypothetical protein [Planomicrobium stackebrandtii]MDQ0428901.1 Skp family chaperone for outer membrane proteins [Planomicrobium stackebrandtii]
MKTSFLKMSVPVLALGFVLMPQVNTQAYIALKAPASEEQQQAGKPVTGTLELGPYQKQLDALEEDLQALVAELGDEETISFEQYQEYQTILDGLIMKLNTVSQEIESESPAINHNFQKLLIVQEKIHEIDVK